MVTFILLFAAPVADADEDTAVAAASHAAVHPDHDPWQSTTGAGGAGGGGDGEDDPG